MAVDKAADQILRMEHITKQFGSVYANRNITFDVRAGEVHTLLGENGAGKSTLMNVLFGLYQPTAGDIYVRGQKVKIESPAQAVKLGIGMVHQHFMLVEAMTVFENIILGDTRSAGIFIDRNARRKEILELSQKYGLDVDLDLPVTELAVGAQQRVEILKALYRGCDVLVLDEPTAGQDYPFHGVVQRRHLIIGKDLAIDVQLPQAAADQLRHLGAEVEDQDLIHRGNSWAFPW